MLTKCKKPLGTSPIVHRARLGKKIKGQVLLPSKSQALEPKLGLRLCFKPDGLRPVTDTLAASAHPILLWSPSIRGPAYNDTMTSLQ